MFPVANMFPVCHNPIFIAPCDIWVCGFPENVKQREVHNMMKFCPQYSDCVLHKNAAGKSYASIRLTSYPAACHAIRILDGATDFDLGQQCQLSAGIEQGRQGDLTTTHQPSAHPMRTPVRPSHDMHLPTLVDRRRRCPVAAATPYRQRPNCKLFCAGIQNRNQKVQEVCTIERVCLHLVPTAEKSCMLAVFWQLLWFQGATLLTRWQTESGLHHRI